MTRGPIDGTAANGASAGSLEPLAVPATPNTLVLEVAATVIAAAAVPGDEIEPYPRVSKSLPAATTDGTPMRAALASANASASAEGSICGPPSERLRTSMPSATAAFTAAASSTVEPMAPLS